MVDFKKKVAAGKVAAKKDQLAKAKMKAGAKEVVKAASAAPAPASAPAPSFRVPGKREATIAEIAGIVEDPGAAMPEFDTFESLRTAKVEVEGEGEKDFIALADGYRQAASKVKVGEVDKKKFGESLLALWYQSEIPEEVKSVKIGLLQARVTKSEGKSTNLSAKKLADILMGREPVFGPPMEIDGEVVLDGDGQPVREEIEIPIFDADITAAIIAAATSITEYDYIQVVSTVPKPKAQSGAPKSE